MSGQRDRSGRFQKGCDPGPGRPRRDIERDYVATLSESVGLDAWRKITEKAVADALAGDPKAREFLAGYLMGKPTGNTLQRLRDDEEGTCSVGTLLGWS